MVQSDFTLKQSDGFAHSYRAFNIKEIAPPTANNKCFSPVNQTIKLQVTNPNKMQSGDHEEFGL